MRISLVIVLLFLSGCKQEKQEMSSEEMFLDQALEANGGFSMWKKIEELSFIKKTRMYFADSTLEMESLQKQIFRNYPSFYGEIQYLNDSLKRRIVQEGNDVIYYEGEEVISDEEKIKKAAVNIQIAYYVIALPYKLMDSGVNVIDVSKTEIEGGMTVNSLHVKHNDHPSENWWIYFHPESKEMLGYLIEHDQRFSEIINDKMTRVQGFSLPAERRSIAWDSKHQNAYLRADYVYSDYKVRLND